MSNRLDVELTSYLDNSSWTWRVVGARQPKGTAERDLLPEGVTVGDTFTVDAEIGIEGITIVAVLASKAPKGRSSREASDALTIEVIGSRGRDDDEAGVTTTLVQKGRRSPGRGGAGGRDGAGITDFPRRTSRPGRSGSEAGGSAEGRPARERHSPRSSATTNPSGTRRGVDDYASRTQRTRTSGAGQVLPVAGQSGRDRRSLGDGPGNQRRAPSERDRFRLSPASTHRKAFLDSLSAEQRAIGEKLVAGGLPAVRRAIDDQNAEAQKAGHPEVPAEPILGMAETLLPRIKVATWCDRAEAALAIAATLPLRELRTLVNSADEATREEPGRTFVARLRESVEAKVAATRTAWEQQITGLVEGGQTVRALRASASPPDPGARLPADLATNLAAAASAAMTSETPPPRWILVAEAAAASPVRVNVRPAGVPSDAPAEVLSAARRLSGRVPALAKLLGLAIPPPPSPILSPANKRPRRSVQRPSTDTVMPLPVDTTTHQSNLQSNKEQTMSSDTQIVELTQKGHIAILTINRPEARNAINGEVAQAMEAAIDRIESDDDTWVTIITGAGTVFCAGADLKAIATGQVAQITTERGGFAGFVRRDRSKPVIAAVDGPALAGGCEIALACDLIIASTAARFGIPEVKRALVAAAGGLFRLPQALPRNVAMQMALTGEPISAERAYHFGLVNEVVDEGKATEAAIAVAGKICSNAPLAVRESRKIVLAANSANDDELWKMSNAGMANMVATQDFLEGPRAFLEKREPVWTGK